MVPCICIYNSLVRAIIWGFRKWTVFSQATMCGKTVDWSFVICYGGMENSRKYGTKHLIILLQWLVIIDIIHDLVSWRCFANEYSGRRKSSCGAARWWPMKPIRNRQVFPQQLHLTVCSLVVLEGSRFVHPLHLSLRVVSNELVA